MSPSRLSLALPARLLVATALLVPLGLLASPHLASAAVIHVPPVTTDPPGIHASGSGATPGTVIDIDIGTTFVCETHADSSGHFDVTCPLPGGVGAGPQTVLARGFHYSASALTTVIPVASAANEVEPVLQAFAAGICGGEHPVHFRGRSAACGLVEAAGLAPTKCATSDNPNDCAQDALDKVAEDLGDLACIGPAVVLCAIPLPVWCAFEASGGLIADQDCIALLEEGQDGQQGKT